MEKYTKAQKKWVARDCIIIPTLEKYIVDDIEGKRLLDIGCGNGKQSVFCEHFDHILVKGPIVRMLVTVNARRLYL